MTVSNTPTGSTGSDTVNRLIAAVSTQGIGAVIALVLVTQVNARLDLLIARVGDVVTACAGH